MICCSKIFYPQVRFIKIKLEKLGHKVTLPNSFKSPLMEEEMKKEGSKRHRTWKARMIRLHRKKIEANDAILVLNLNRNSEKRYIGGATFLEIYEAFVLKRKIFLFCPAPDNFLKDEILGMGAKVIYGDVAKIK